MNGHTIAGTTHSRSRIVILGALGLLLLPLHAYAQDCRVSYSYNPAAGAPALATDTAEAEEGQTVNVTRNRVRKVTNIANHAVEIQVTSMIAGAASGTKWVSLAAKNSSDPPGGASYSTGVTLYVIKCPAPAATAPPPAPTVPIISEVMPNYYVSGVDAPKRTSAIIRGIPKDIVVKGTGINAATGISVLGKVTGTIVNRSLGAITVRFTSDEDAPRGERSVTVNFPVGVATFRLVVLGTGNLDTFTQNTPPPVDINGDETFTITGTNLDTARLECAFEGATTVTRTSTVWQFRMRFDSPGQKPLCLADMNAPNHNEWSDDYFWRTANSNMFLSSVTAVAPQPTLPPVPIQPGPALFQIPPGTKICAPTINWPAVQQNPLIASLHIIFNWDVPFDPQNPRRPTQQSRDFTMPPNATALPPQAWLRAGETYQWRIQALGPPAQPGAVQAFGPWSQPQIINVTAMPGAAMPLPGPCAANDPVW